MYAIKHALPFLARLLWTSPAERVYECPMRPEIRSDSPGECPKCHMSLKPKHAEDAS